MRVYIELTDEDRLLIGSGSLPSLDECTDWAEDVIAAALSDLTDDEEEDEPWEPTPPWADDA